LSAHDVGLIAISSAIKVFISRATERMRRI